MSNSAVVKIDLPESHREVRVTVTLVLGEDSRQASNSREPSRRTEVARPAKTKKGQDYSVTLDRIVQSMSRASVEGFGNAVSAIEKNVSDWPDDWRQKGEEAILAAKKAFEQESSDVLELLQMFHEEHAGDADGPDLEGELSKLLTEHFSDRRWVTHGLKLWRHRASTPSVVLRGDDAGDKPAETDATDDN